MASYSEGLDVSKIKKHLREVLQAKYTLYIASFIRYKSKLDDDELFKNARNKIFLCELSFAKNK